MSQERALFEIAAGSVAGRSHARAGRANQDAYAVRQRDGRLVAVVADGCGSGARSEVGAEIGARVVAEQALLRMEAGGAVGDEALWDGVRERALAELGAVAQAMGGRLEDTVTDLFLFTVLGVAIDGERAAVFGIGDGLFAIEPERGPVDQVLLGPFPGNAPPYLSYGLLGGGPRFCIHREMAAAEVHAVLLGTDGASELDSLCDKQVPGGEPGDLVGPLSQMWRHDRYFQNRDALRRRLSMIGREATRPLWNERRMDRRPGLLEDDTTVVVVRRR